MTSPSDRGADRRARLARRADRLAQELERFARGRQVCEADRRWAARLLALLVDVTDPRRVSPEEWT